MSDVSIMPQLIDEAAWLALWDEGYMGWSNGESIAQTDHPRHGMLTAIYCTEGVFVVAGRYIDGRASKGPATVCPYGELLGPNEAAVSADGV